MLEIKRFQDYLTDHEVDVFSLQLDLLEEFIEVFFSDGILGVSAFAESLVDVLLIVCDQLGYLNKHLVLSGLGNKLIFADQFGKIILEDLLFNCFAIFNGDYVTNF
jgi:hypothetical protein